MNKFKVWDLETNTMYYPGEDGTQLIFGVTNVYGEEGHHTWQLWDEDGEITREGKAEVLRYAEQKDINNMEIFEGHVLEVESAAYPFEKNWIGIVKMIDGSWMVENLEGTDGQYLFIEERSVEVIGNIYENPELLEGDE